MGGGGGGGGAVRAAAKVAGIGVLNGGLRGMPTMPAAEQSVRSATRPVSAIMSSSAMAPPKTASADVSLMPVAWDDWEFADGELTIASGEPMSRVVFGGLPSFQEAMEATTELKDAIDMLYPSSPKSTVFTDHFAADHVPDLSLVTSPESQTKSCVTFEATSAPSVPKHVLQAFKLLSGSPKVQTVVASIASDPNILNAVMDNPELKDLLSSQQRYDEFPEPQSPKKLQESSDASQTENSKSAFIDVRGMARKVKRSVLQMVSNVSNYFQHIFGPSEADSNASDATENAKTTFVDTTLGKTVIGLAIVVVMLVVLKRA